MPLPGEDEVVGTARPVAELPDVAGIDPLVVLKKPEGVVVLTGDRLPLIPGVFVVKPGEI